METATEEEKQEVFSEMLASAALLMEDHFGNYVVQKFFEFGSHHQIQILCGLLRGNVVMLSLQTYGCRVMQKAIETLVEDDQVYVCVCVCVGGWVCLFAPAYLSAPSCVCAEFN